MALGEWLHADTNKLAAVHLVIENSNI